MPVTLAPTSSDRRNPDYHHQRQPLADDQRPGPLTVIAISLGAVVLACLGRWGLDQVVGDFFPFLTFFVAVALVTWFAGRLAGLITLLASGAAALYFFLPPRFSIALTEPGTPEGMLMYLIAGWVLILLFDSRRRAWLRAVSQAELLQVTLGSIGDGVITTDHRGIVTHMNSLAGRLTGWDCDEAIGRAIEDVMTLVDAETRDPVTITTLTNGPAALLVHRDRGECWVESSTAFLPRKSGPAGHVIAFRDVTARRMAQIDAETSLTKAQLVADAVPSLISYVSKDFRYLLTNRAYETWFERPRSEINGRTMEEVLGPAAWQTIRPHVIAALAGQHVAFEVEAPYRSGGSRWIAASYTPDIGEDGTTRGLVAHVTDITAHKRAEQALRESEERLRETDRRKDEFLATLAHELRNPLAPVRNALEVLNHSAHDSALADKARGTLDRQITHMVRLIDDLLDVSRINTGRLVLRRERTDLREAARHAVDASHVAIDQRRHSFSIDLPAEPVWVDADPIRLAQVFSNILNNAAKYSEPGGAISLRMERDGSQVIVKVRDTGIGIPQEKLAGIFDLFAQLDSSLEKSAGGLGIGLSLVKRLVEMHGGSVRAESGGLGQGTEFICQLPLASAAAAPAPAGATLPAPTAPLRILVVDDNRDSAESLAMVLTLDGHEARCAYDGEQALDEIAGFHPQLVLLDIGLPRMNGYDVCRAARRAQNGNGSISIVALTGWGQEGDRQETRAAGFDAHFVKPVDLTELKRFIADLAG